MTPSLVNLSSFTVGGISVRTTNKDEMSSSTAKLSSLWQSFYEKGIANQVPNKAPGTDVYGVYSSYESDVNGAYTVTAGVKVQHKSSNENFSHVDIESGDYLVFEGRGKIPEIIMTTWQAIWDYFSHDKEFKRRYTTDFELYNVIDKVDIYISVTKNKL